MAKSWSAQKWGKVRHEGKLVVLVHRDKEARSWLGVSVDDNVVVSIGADVDVEILPVVPEEDRTVLKKSYKPMIRAWQANTVTQ